MLHVIKCCKIKKMGCVSEAYVINWTHVVQRKECISETLPQTMHVPVVEKSQG
jgi:hypothetical protein